MIGMAFRPIVSRVRIWLTNHRDRLIRLRLLSNSKAREDRVARFGYGVIAFSGEGCLSRVAAYSRAGDVVEPTLRDGCGHGAPGFRGQPARPMTTRPLAPISRRMQVFWQGH